MFKRIILILITFLVISPMSYGANYYVDLVGGDDGTGDGTIGNEYLTIDGVRTNETLTGGDEIRVLKSTVTQLSGTASYTNGSATVTTSIDHSGTLSDGDLISKNSHTQTGNEGWWSVASVSTTTITLDKEYWGTTDASANIYYNTPTSQVYTDWNLAEDGTSEASRIKIEGGWNTTGPTRDGYTFVSTTGAYGAVYNSSNYQEISYFVTFNDSTTASYGGFYSTSGIKGSYYHDIIALSSGTNVRGFVINSDHETIDNIYVSGSGSGFVGANMQDCTVTDVYIYSQSYTLTRGGLHLENSGQNVFDNINIYNTGDFGIYSEQSDNNFYKNITVEDTGDDCVYMTSGANALFHTISCTTIGGHGIYADDNFTNLVVNNPTLTSITDDDYHSQVRVSTYFGIANLFVIDGSNNTQYAPESTRASDTTDARSGTALKISPSATTGDGTVDAIRIGSTKVSSTASDLTLGVYLKKDASFNGSHVHLLAVQDSEWLYAPSEKTLTTSYAQYTVVVTAADLDLNEYIDLYIMVDGTAGSVFVDDFSATQ